MAERAHVDIRLLGPVAAFRDGEAGALGGPRQRAVLARLALVAGQVVTVDRLIDDVWGGEPPLTATNTLQSYVSLLRRALGSAEFVRRDGPGYVLDVDRTVLDAHRFEDGVAEGTALVGREPAVALELLDAALGEWRGPCLADVADEEWARSASVRWDELRLAATETRFDALLALGRAAEAATGLERVTDEHPLREGFVRRLMLALYRSGRQADALRAFSRTRALLADELGLDPTPDLQALQLAILDHDPTLAAPPGAAPADGTSAAVPAAPPEVPDGGRAAPKPVSRSTPIGPFRPMPLPGAAARAAGTALVGRDTQLATLHAAWAKARAGVPRLVVATGEAGAGKSTLAGRFAIDVQEAGATVLWGRAAQEALVPFEPLVQALRTALHALSPRARERVVADRGALSLLLPELPQLVPTMGAGRPSPDIERYVLLETIADLLEVESSIAPILLVIDDIQWADGPTVRVLDHVLRHERASNVMILATQRVPSEDPHADLDRLLLELTRDGDLVRVDVGALGVDDVASLLRLAGQSDDAAEDLHAVTGGNAFFVAELIASGDADGQVGELPDSIRTMIGTRLERLPAASAHVVSLAAVAGKLATLPVLVAATELDADEVLDAADVAVAAGLLREDGAGRLVTPHALVRHAVLARLSGARRQDLHRRVGAALVQAGGTEVSAAEIAHHLFAAGGLVERSDRLASAIAAGEEALSRLAYEEAAAWAEHGRSLAGTGGTPALLGGLDVLDSGARLALGDAPGAQASARHAAALAMAADDPLLLARAAEVWVLSISGVGFDFGQPADPELIDVLTTTIAALPADATEHQVWLRSMLVSVLVETGQFERQEQLSEEALAIAGRSNRPALIASALHARRLALWRRDRLDERLGVALEAVEQARRSGDVHLEMTTMLVAMTDLLESGRVEEQLAMLDDFAELAATQRTPLYDVYASFLRSCRLVVIGEYDEGMRVADAALADGLTAHGNRSQMAHAGQLFCTAWDHDQLGDVVEFVEQMSAANPDFAIWRVALLGSLVAAGRDAEARVQFERLVTPDAVVLDDDSLFFTGACFLVEVARALDDRERAAVLRATLEPYVGRVAVSGMGGVGIGPVRRYVGVAALVTGDLDAAIEHLHLAVGESTRHGSRPFTARAHRDLAVALARRGGSGDEALAADHAHQAMAIADEIGLVFGAV